MVIYEELLDRDFDWALREGSMHFEQQSAVHRTLKKIASQLERLGIEYAVAGGMALFFHGYRRFTEDIDILVTADSLKRIHDNLEGLGYVAPLGGSRNLRDAESGVRIEFLVTGAFPGDGKPKPVAFPDPGAASVDIGGIRFLTLPRLIELKLASGMTAPTRLQDLADVQRLIQVLKMPAEAAGDLNPFVQAKFRELCQPVQEGNE